MCPYFFMQALVKAYRFLNVLSLDVVAGAILSALFFARLLHVQVLPYGLIALGLTVWIIYTVDHLRDARTISHDASSFRHWFHQKHFKTLTRFVVVAIAIDSVVILFIRKQVFEWGMMLAAIVVIYLVVQRYLRIVKELFVAILYTAGVLLPSLSVTSIELDQLPYILILQFALVAWVNLLIFSWFDYELDLIDNQISFATLSGKNFTSAFIWLLSFFQLMIALWNLFTNYHRNATVIFCLMHVALLGVFIVFKSRTRSDSFRLLGDAIFFIPGIYLLWGNL